MIEYLACAIIPFIAFSIVLAGIIKKQKVFEDFAQGAKKGIKIAVGLLPTLIGLLVGVGCIRASGLFDAMAGLFAGIAEQTGIPTQIIPLSLAKMLSSSAATGMLLDIFKTNGPDSPAGRMGALILSGTETILYTMSVYFFSVKITKTRWTLPGAIICVLAGVAAAVFVSLFLWI